MIGKVITVIDTAVLYQDLNQDFIGMSEWAQGRSYSSSWRVRRSRDRHGKFMPSWWGADLSRSWTLGLEVFEKP